MNTRRYAPDKLPEQIMAFYRENLDEELSYGDLATKFGVTKQRVREVVYSLLDGRAKGVLESAQVVRLKSKGVRSDG